MEALVGAGDVFEEFFEHVGIGLALADLTTRYLRVNGSYAQLLGRNPEDLIGLPFADAVHPGAQDDAHGHFDALLAGRVTALSVEERYLTADGRDVWVLHGIDVVRDDRRNPSWLAVSAQDVTERRRSEQGLRDLTAALAEQAVRDPLTGLANRTLLEERLRGTLARDARTGGTSAVLFLDLDGFKAVNDRHGHAVGDGVLQTVASRLAGGVRPSDTVARLGGDEFVVLVDGATEERLQPLVARLRTAVGQPVQVGRQTLTVGVSVGVALSRAGDADPESLLALADRAMYAAKRSGEPSD